MRKYRLRDLAALALLGLSFWGGRVVADEAPVAVPPPVLQPQPIPEGALPQPGAVAPLPLQAGYTNPGYYNYDDQQMRRPMTPIGAWVLSRTAGTVSPDWGWGRPIKRPIYREPIQYYRYWPAAWYGTPEWNQAFVGNMYPQVYMPNDTTQLGFTYQRVPTWMPNPGMLPPTPWPANWHYRESPPLGRGVQPVAGGYYVYGQGVVAQPAVGAPTPAAPIQVPQPINPDGKPAAPGPNELR